MTTYNWLWKLHSVTNLHLINVYIYSRNTLPKLLLVHYTVNSNYIGCSNKTFFYSFQTKLYRCCWPRIVNIIWIRYFSRRAISDWKVSRNAWEYLIKACIRVTSCISMIFTFVTCVYDLYQISFIENDLTAILGFAISSTFPKEDLKFMEIKWPTQIQGLLSHELCNLKPDLTILNKRHVFLPLPIKEPQVNAS